MANIVRRLSDAKWSIQKTIRITHFMTKEDALGKGLGLIEIQIPITDEGILFGDLISIEKTGTDIVLLYKHATVAKPAIETKRTFEICFD